MYPWLPGQICRWRLSVGIADTQALCHLACQLIQLRPLLLSYMHLQGGLTECHPIITVKKYTAQGMY